MVLINFSQQVLYRLDNWINEGSAWTIEYIDGEYIFLFIVHYQEVHILDCLINQKNQWRV